MHGEEARTPATGTSSLVVALILLCTAAAGADTCTVPSTAHPTIQSAVVTPSCSQIDVAAGTYTETVVVDRSLELTGAGSTSSFIRGGIEVQAGSAAVTGFHLSGPGEALWAHSGAEVAGFDLVVVNGMVETPLFTDDFESGGTGEWSAVVP
jgi:nitrous oxidase accessory protein NosD